MTQVGVTISHIQALTVLSIEGRSSLSMLTSASDNNISLDQSRKCPSQSSPYVNYKEATLAIKTLSNGLFVESAN